jgi:hypothetical protein
MKAASLPQSRQVEVLGDEQTLLLRRDSQDGGGREKVWSVALRVLAVVELGSLGGGDEGGEEEAGRSCCCFACRGAAGRAGASRQVLLRCSVEGSVSCGLWRTAARMAGDRVWREELRRRGKGSVGGE